MLATLARRSLVAAHHSGLRGLCTAAGEAAKITVNGVSLHYRTNGSTGLPLVCIPGSMGTAETDFGPQLRDLADEFQVVSFDPRGYGKSQPPERTFPPDFYQQDADDAAALMAALGHEKYAVMGWSDGAISATLLAASKTSNVDRLIMFGGNAYFTKDDIEAFDATRDVEGSWSKRMKETHYPTYGAEGLQRLWTGACDAWAAIYHDKGGDVCSAQAKSIQCPTMILHGAKDPICLSEHPEWFKANIPGFKEMHILPEGKHNLHLRFADEVNGLIRAFCKS